MLNKDWYFVYLYILVAIVVLVYNIFEYEKIKLYLPYNKKVFVLFTILMETYFWPIYLIFSIVDSVVQFINRNKEK